MSQSCKECVHNNPNDTSDLAYACLNCSWPPFAGEPTNFKPKPITNADRIRSMTDEELAEFFAQQEYRKPVFDGWLPLCYHVMGPRRCNENGCEKCWLDWLKQEADK